MRVKVSKSKNSNSFSIIKDISINGKRTTQIVKRLGNEQQLRQAHPNYEPLAWAKEQARLMTQQEKKDIQVLIKKFSAVKLIKKDKQNTFNVCTES